MERRFNGKELGWELSTPSPKGLRGRSDISTGTSSESDRGPETWRKKLLPTRHDMLIRRKQGNVRTDAQPCFNEAIGASIQLGVSFEGTLLPRGYVEGW